MPVDNKTFEADLSAFAHESTTWCLEESKKEVLSAMKVIRSILDDVKRRRAPVESTVDSMKSLEEGVRKVEQSQGKRHQSEVIRIIEGLDSEGELRQPLEPVLKALSFQKRYQDYLKAYRKGADVWIRYRALVLAEPDKADELIRQAYDELEASNLTRETKAAFQKVVGQLFDVAS